MSLFRLAILGGVGYLVYRMMSSTPQAASGGMESLDQRAGNRGEPERGESGSPISGPGEGMRTEVFDSSGGQSHRVVGRGVVRR